MLFQQVRTSVTIPTQLLAPFTGVIRRCRAATDLHFNGHTRHVRFITLSVLRLPLQLLFRAATRPHRVDQVMGRRHFHERTVAPNTANFLVVKFSVTQGVGISRRTGI